nr:MAG TPA: hypothetical protein [Caudoviricetes sp.]
MGARLHESRHVFPWSSDAQPRLVVRVRRGFVYQHML